MEFRIDPLPYDLDALEPHISARTLDFHYDKHHKGYLEKVRKAIEGKPEAEKSLVELIRTTDGSLFNHVAQVWNHDFYWKSMSPEGGGRPGGAVGSAVESGFGSFENFKQTFAEAAKGEFGSGWAWLVLDPSGRLRVISSTDAENPIRQQMKPLLTCDVWEHAYYLDYQNDRASYVQGFIDHLIDWGFVDRNLSVARGGEGDPEADRRYRAGASGFAESGKVEEAARKAAREE